jgi:hypothetical protein
MTKRTRYFLAGSGALLVLGLCTGLLAYYGGFPQVVLAGPDGPEEFGYIPADASVVAYADVREVMVSEFRQRFRAAVPNEDKGRQDFEQRTGIDVERDVDHVVGCLFAAEGEAGTPSGLVLARGRFDAVRLESLASEHGAVVEDYKGTRVMRIERTTERRGPHALAFLESGLLAIGDVASIHRAIDTRAAGASANVTTNQALMDQVKEIGTGYNAWAVGRFDAIASRAKLPDAVNKQIPPISYFSAGGRVNGGLSGTVRAETHDAQSAENLRDVVRGFLALARLQAGSKPEIQQALESLQLSGTGTTVALSFEIPAAVIEAMAPKPKQGE